MSYQKKLEKMKLLALGQETILQNYIKDKYAGSQEPDLLKDYYRYMKAKITLVKDLQEMRGKNVLSFFGENEEKNLRNQAGVNPHSLLYDQYCEIKEEDCFS